ncbi:MAG TPA: hypothetical protein VMZ52_20445 [Bryobacteraceae bacterium]|nr:hypothetical protein [Bryobacteraceae bacterium]
MLRRVTGGFEGPSGSQVQIVALAANNNGVEAATFEYAETILTPEVIQGHPGCTFTLAAGVEIFETLVIFNPGASAGRYDLFEVDAGNLVDLNRAILTSNNDPTLSFRIRGVAAVLAEAPRTMAAAAAGPEAAAKKNSKASEKPKRHTGRKKK